MKLKFKKPTGIGIVKIILWAAMIGLFILHIVKRHEWISFIINLLFVFFCILVVTDKKETWGEKAVWWILMILKIIDIAGQIRDGIF